MTINSNSPNLAEIHLMIQARSTLERSNYYISLELKGVITALGNSNLTAKAGIFLSCESLIDISVPFLINAYNLDSVGRLAYYSSALLSFASCLSLVFVFSLSNSVSLHLLKFLSI